MFKLFGLVTLPLRMVINLMKLPFTILSCMTKAGCLLVMAGVPVLFIVLYVK